MRSKPEVIYGYEIFETDFKENGQHKLKQWCEYTSLKADLSLAKENLSILLKMNINTFTEKIVQRALIYSALISYRRCFNTGNRGIKIDANILKEHKEEHNRLLILADKQIAHFDDNEDAKKGESSLDLEKRIPCIIFAGNKFKPDVYLEVDILELFVNKQSLKDAIEGFKEITEVALKHINKKINSFVEEVAKNVRNKKFDTESRKKVFKLTPLNQGESPKHLKYNFDDQKYDMKPL